MTNETHNYQQLLELAVLEAYGLLEPIESDLFDRSFHNATAAIQDEIIQLQQEIATDASLLPTDDPAKALRQMVLDAVASAADTEAQRLAPLALIGARVSAAKQKLRLSTPVTFWRTVAMILFGVVVMLAVMTVDSQRRTTRITEYALNVDTSETLATLAGAEFIKFIDNPYCHITRLEREEGDPSGYLRIAIHELTGEGYVIGIDLAKGEEIILQGTTSDGTVIELARITADGSVVGREFNIDPATVRGMTIAAIDIKTNTRWI